MTDHDLEDLDNVVLSVYHLIFISNTIEYIVAAYSKIYGKVDEDCNNALRLATCSIVLIHTVSFLEEYNGFVNSKNEDINQLLISIKKVVKPAMKQIQQWKELQDFRNNALAHNLRDGKKESISVFERGLDSYDIPNSAPDFHVLVNCVLIIKEVYGSAFEAQLKTLQSTFDKKGVPSRPSKFRDVNEAKFAVEKIRNEVNANIDQLKADTGA